MNENGYCPHCNADLDGESIYDTFIKQGKSEETAKLCVEMYCGTKWGRQIGHTSFELDRITEWECPDCHKRWKR